MNTKFLFSKIFLTLGVVSFLHAGQNYNYNYDTNKYNYVKGGYTKSNTQHDKDIDKAAELELIGLNPPVKATYNPSKNIGQWLNNKLSSTNSQTGEKKASWFQKTGTSIWNTLNANKSDEKKVNKFFQKYNLPVSAKVTKEKVANMTLSYSLVNDKCEIDPKKIWAEQMEKLVKKYKEMWNQLKSKGLWKMWAINKLIEKTCYGIGYTICVPFQKYFQYFDRKHFINEYKSCLSKAAKNAAQYQTATEGGMNIVAAGLVQGTGFAPISNPSVYYIPCGPDLIPCGTPLTMPKATAHTKMKIDPAAAAAISACYWEVYGKTYGNAVKKCVKHYQTECYSLFNGKIDLGISMGLLNFDLKQQACILKKYNMNVDLTKIITKAFDMNKNGKIILKNTKDNDPAVAARIMGKIFKIYGPSGLGKTIVRNNYETAKKLGLGKKGKIYSLLSYYNFAGWLNLVFNTPQTVKVYKNGSYQIEYSLGRWPFSSIQGITKKIIGIENSYPVSIYKECGNIINYTSEITGKTNIENFFVAMASNNTDKEHPNNVLWEISNFSIVSKDNPFKYEKINGFAPGYVPKSIKGEALTPRNIFVSTLPDLYSKLIGQINDPAKFYKIYLANGIPYFDLNEIVLMNQACYTWANLMKEKLKEIQASQFDRIKRIEIQMTGNRKYAKQSGVLLEFYKKNWETLKLRIKELAKLGNEQGLLITKLKIIENKMMRKINNSKNPIQRNKYYSPVIRMEMY